MSKAGGFLKLEHDSAFVFFGSTAVQMYANEQMNRRTTTLERDAVQPLLTKPTFLSHSEEKLETHYRAGWHRIPHR